MVYYKITNKNENYNGYQYQDGLNVSTHDFIGGHIKDGFTFADIHNIHKLFQCGIYIREITLPTDDPDFQMIKGPVNGVWKANKIIFGKRYLLSNAETLKMLIEKGADITYIIKWISQVYFYNRFSYARRQSKYKTGYEHALCWASKNGLLEVVEHLIGKDTDIHANYDYALRWASRNGHLEIVKYLVDNGANIHAVNNYSLTAASDNGHLEVVKYLTAKSSENFRCYEALHYACENNHVEIVKYLIEREINNDASENYVDGLFSYYPFIGKLKSGHIDFFNFLIEKGADIHVNNDILIIWASKDGHLELVNFLIEKGINIHADNDNALRKACENGHLETVKLLVEKGADIHADSNDALSKACENGRLETVKYLIDNGANISFDIHSLCRASLYHPETFNYIINKDTRYTHTAFQACCRCINRKYLHDYAERYGIPDGPSIKPYCRKHLDNYLEKIKKHTRII
jgi:ankyrin repeat protein